MRNCPNCNYKNDDANNFCKNCGTKLTENPEKNQTTENISNSEITAKEITKHYQEIKNSISSALTENNFDASQKDEMEFLQGIKTKLNKINEDFKNEITELEESSDWDNFCISFFGETNAGKSTIIDTLRIIYNEESRLQNIIENQKEVKDFFNQNNEYYSKLVESVGQMKTFIKDLEQNKTTFEAEKDSFYKEKQQYREDYEKLKAFYKIKRFSAKALVISALSSGFITAGIYTVIQYFI